MANSGASFGHWFEDQKKKQEEENKEAKPFFSRFFGKSEKSDSGDIEEGVPFFRKKTEKASGSCGLNHSQRFRLFVLFAACGVVFLGIALFLFLPIVQSPPLLYII